MSAQPSKPAPQQLAVRVFRHRANQQQRETLARIWREAQCRNATIGANRGS